MLQIDYIAKRSLKTGHVVDTQYTINTELSRRDRRYATVGSQSVALSGNTTTIVHRRDEIWRLESQIITTTTVPDIDDMIEFLDSVASGETFQLDLSGTLEDYVMDSLRRPYTAIRLGRLDIFRYGFTVRKLP